MEPVHTLSGYKVENSIQEELNMIGTQQNQDYKYLVFKNVMLQNDKLSTTIADIWMLANIKDQTANED